MALVLILFGAILCLVPLGLYCLQLAQVNSRARPTILPGPWDFAGVLFALSGFLIYGGPVIALATDSAWRSALGQREFGKLRGAVSGSAETTWLVLVGYAVVVVGGAALTLYSRRAVTAVYNVAPQVFTDTITAACDKLKLRAERQSTTYTLTPLADDAKPVAYPVAAVTLDVFPATCHATLYWRLDDGFVRTDLERELAAGLQTAESPHNPAASTFATAATTIFLAVLFCLVLLIVFLIASRWR